MSDLFVKALALKSSARQSLMLESGNISYFVIQSILADISKKVFELVSLVYCWLCDKTLCIQLKEAFIVRAQLSLL